MKIIKKTIRRSEQSNQRKPLYTIKINKSRLEEIGEFIGTVIFSIALGILIFIGGLL